MGETGSDVWDFYRRCVALRQRFQDVALRSVPRPRLAELGRQLGLPIGDELAQLTDEDLSYVFDIAVHTAPPGRSRAIERIGRQHTSAEDEAGLVQRALVQAWFSVFRALGPHPEAGLLLEDTLLGGEVWLLDEGLAASAAAPGAVLATRLGRVQGFAITCGAVAVLDDSILAGFRKVLAASGIPPAEMLADPRFATLVYQRALGFHSGDDRG